MSDIIWKPTQSSINSSQMMEFMKFINDRESTTFQTYNELYDWSISSTEKFWALFWDFSQIIYYNSYTKVVDNINQMPGANWFEGATLNFAENLLKYKDNHTAIISIDENQNPKSTSYKQLYLEVSKLACSMKNLGIGINDRVVGFLPNIPETIIAMLATSSLGAIWSSCSPDFGANGVLDRFKQIKPKLIFSADSYIYNGKRIDCMDKLKIITDQISSIDLSVIIQSDGNLDDKIYTDNVITWIDFISKDENMKLEFDPLPFMHPLFIMFSSGTTGKPKSIVHSAGGTLIQHIKEHRLHTNLNRDDVIFYFTTCGWMMWNWLVTSLSTGSTIVLYDGNPFSPNDTTLLEISDKLGITIFGTSAKYISTLRSKEIIPKTISDFSTLRLILSTGSPLSGDNFDFVYNHWKKDVQLSSISGGTDIISCFALGNPLLPVYRGELQSRGLGMAVDSYDNNGNSIRNAKGELVCKLAFPSMPIYFWNDKKGEKYKSAYFSNFPNIWSHGDYIEINDHDGVLIYGRSDATLNPGGVRIGTAEIYRIIDQLEDIEDSLVIGQPWEDDERIILFIKLNENVLMDESIKNNIKKNIRQKCSPRHIPAKIIPIEDIPYTLNGKKVEIAIKNIIQNLPIKNKDSLSNPSSLEFYKNLDELKF